MADWDPVSLGATFKYRADSADRYRREIGPKMSKQPSYKVLYDIHLAEYTVFERLHGRTFLSTQIALVAELRNMREHPVKGVGENDEAQFRMAYIRFVDELLLTYEGPET